MPTLFRPLCAIVGEAPSPDPDVVEVLCPHTTSGRRLMELLGMSEPEYLALPRRNLLPHRTGGWRRRHRDRARAEAERTVEGFHLDHEHLILLGTNVARAFELAHARPLTSHYVFPGSGVICHAHVIPHPSGRNRWYNSPRNAGRTRRFLASLTEGFEERVERRPISADRRRRKS